MHTSAELSEALAVAVSCTGDSLIVALEDGRTLSVPLAWFPRLLAASSSQRKQWELIGRGIGIHWKAIDEDISVASLLRPEKFMRPAPVTLPRTTRITRATRSKPARAVRANQRRK
jgi:Protein of unknown function (DUF2442)